MRTLAAFDHPRFHDQEDGLVSFGAWQSVLGGLLQAHVSCFPGRKDRRVDRREDWGHKRIRLVFDGPETSTTCSAARCC